MCAAPEGQGRRGERSHALEASYQFLQEHRADAAVAMVGEDLETDKGRLLCLAIDVRDGGPTGRLVVRSTAQSHACG